MEYPWVVAWAVKWYDEFQAWLDGLNEATYKRVMAAADILREDGPHLGRPLVDSVASSRFAN